LFGTTSPPEDYQISSIFYFLPLFKQLPFNFIHLSIPLRCLKEKNMLFPFGRDKNIKGRKNPAF